MDSIDPNVILSLSLASLAATALGWLYRKVKGEHVPSYEELIAAALTAEVEDALEAKLSADATRAKLEACAWSALERVGLKKSATLRIIVAKGVEVAMVRVRQKLRELANAAAATRLPGELDKLQAATRDIAAAFEAKPESERTVPPLGLNIEIVNELP